MEFAFALGDGDFELMGFSYPRSCWRHWSHAFGDDVFVASPDSIPRCRSLRRALVRISAEDDIERRRGMANFSSTKRPSTSC